MHPDQLVGGSVGPSRQTGPTPIACKKTTQQINLTTALREQAQVDALIAYVFGEIAQCASIGEARFAALRRAAKTRDTAAVDKYFEAVFEIVAKIDTTRQSANSTGRARDPKDDLLVEAASEYRSQRGDRLTLNSDARTYAQVCADVDAYERQQQAALRRRGRAPRLRREDIASAKTQATRDTLKREFPAEYKAGVRTAFLGEQKYPADFCTWPANRRNAWFAGFSLGLADRAKQHPEASA